MRTKKPKEVELWAQAGMLYLSFRSCCAHRSGRRLFSHGLWSSFSIAELDDRGSPFGIKMDLQPGKGKSFPAHVRCGLSVDREAIGPRGVKPAELEYFCGGAIFQAVHEENAVFPVGRNILQGRPISRVIMAGLCG